MTIEERIPLNETKTVLGCYTNLYRCVHKPIKVYNIKVRTARLTLISVILSIIKIAVLAIFISIGSNQEISWYPFAILIAIILSVSIILDFFYFQKVSGKKLPKVRFRYSYYINCIAHDIYEFSWFKKYFGLKVPAFFLILGIGKSKAIESITNWGYMLGEEYSTYIDEYNKKYRNYREYVNFGQHWSVCYELLEIISSGRACDGQTALNVLDAKKHRQRVERYAEEVAYEARSAAEAAWAEASAYQDIAKSEAEEAEYLRQIRDSLR